MKPYLVSEMDESAEGEVLQRADSNGAGYAHSGGNERTLCGNCWRRS